MEKLTFQKHPSTLLNNLYKVKSHQGANPIEAKVLFIGRDPNWAINVEQMSLFPFVEEYLTDGISFWNKHNIHHPFLLPNYKGDGKRYHTIFSKLNFNNSYSNKITFLELIGFPTTGMAKKDNKGFIKFLLSEENKNHLIELDSLMNNSNKLIFIAWGLIEDFKLINKTTGLFSNFASLDKATMDIKDLNNYNNIFIHRHFSDAISNETINKIANKVNFYLDNN